MDVKVFFFNALRECCYVVWDDTKECVIIDPGCYDDREFQRLKGFIGENGLAPVKLLLTHGHFDHIFGLESVSKEWNLPVCLHHEDIPQVEGSIEFAASLDLKIKPFTGKYQDLHDGDRIGFGNTFLNVIWTPGHTEGGLCFYNDVEKVLFSGDTLFQGSVGRTDHPGGDYAKLMNSLTMRIAVLPPDTDVLCGHGYPTTIGAELASNPFLCEH